MTATETPTETVVLTEEEIRALTEKKARNAKRMELIKKIGSHTAVASVAAALCVVVVKFASSEDVVTVETTETLEQPAE